MCNCDYECCQHHVSFYVYVYLIRVLSIPCLNLCVWIYLLRPDSYNVTVIGRKKTKSLPYYVILFTMIWVLSASSLIPRVCILYCERCQHHASFHVYVYCTVSAVSIMPHSTCMYIVLKTMPHSTCMYIFTSYIHCYNRNA